MQYIKLALPLALASSAFANPLLRRDACTPDNCLAAVTGKAALGDDGLRADHCKSYLATTVTPEAITETTTVVGVETDDAWGKWKREQVTVCPNEVPNYASACETAAYSSACSCFGFFGDSTTTLKPTTTTKTVYVSATGTCSGGVSTKTVTVTIPDKYSSTTYLTSAITSTIFQTNSFCPSSTSSASTSTFTTTSAVTSTVTTTKSGSFCPAFTETVTETASVCPTSTGLTSASTSTSTVTSAVTSTVTTTESASSCPTTSATTSTVTTTESASSCPTTSATTSTVTTTETTTSTTTAGPEPTTCLTQDQVDSFVSAFTDFLENTDTGSALGYSGPFNSELAATTFTDDFEDYSDSINYMAGYPLGDVTFPSRDAFIGGQGSQYPVGVISKNTWLGCKSFTWHYNLITGAGANKYISGINVFEVTDDLTQIKTNYAEFNNGAWIENIGNPAQLCGASSSAAAAAATTTTSADATSTTPDAGATPPAERKRY